MPITPTQILGAVAYLSPYNEAIDVNDECSECAARLVDRRFPFRMVLLADCGRYCSERCAHSHADFLAEVMNERHRQENANNG